MKGSNTVRQTSRTRSLTLKSPSYSERSDSCQTRQGTATITERESTVEMVELRSARSRLSKLNEVKVLRD
jgi:hypothetical protein